MAKYKHLTLDDRIQIQSYLDRGFTFKEISIQLHKVLLLLPKKCMLT